MLRCLAAGAFVLTDKLEQSSRVLTLQALLHLLRGDDGIVVLADNSIRHRAYPAEGVGAPRTQYGKSDHESEVAEQQLCAQLHSGLSPKRVLHPRGFVPYRHNLYRRIPNVAQEAIDNRAVQEKIPS